MPITSPLPSPSLKPPQNLGTFCDVNECDIPKCSLEPISELTEFNEQNQPYREDNKFKKYGSRLTSIPRKSQLLSSLRCGSQFSGYQRSGKEQFPVEIDIKMVDLQSSTLCGYLKIKNLTKENPSLTTYFEGEIIGSEYGFHTRKWNTDEDIDRQHWAKFQAFNSTLSDNFNKDNFVYDSSDDFVFMRWKEMFLVPNYRKKDLDGVSFSGFYYICYQISTGSINGYYYHPSAAEWFQDLNLTYVPCNTFQSYEFR